MVTSWGLVVAAVVVIAVALVLLALVFVIGLGGALLLLRRRAPAAVSPAPAPERVHLATSVPLSEEPRTVRMLADPHPKPPPPSASSPLPPSAKSLSGFPSLPPGGRLDSALVAPLVPGMIRSVMPSSPPPPPKKTSGLLGFFDEPVADPGDAAKTELFQRGRMEHTWEDDSGDGAEATEIFSALTHETGDEGFAEDEETARNKKR